MDFSEILDTPLEHAGVKGMKWGRRNSKPSGTQVKSSMSGSSKRKGFVKRNYGTVLGGAIGTILLPGVGTAAGSAIGASAYRRQSRKRIKEAVGSNVTLNKKSLRKASHQMRKYSDVKISVGKNSKKFE